MSQQIYSLKKDSAELHSVLMDGRIHRYGEPWAALPRERVKTSRSNEAVIFEIIRLSDFVRPPIYKTLWSAVRPETLLWSFIPFSIIYVYGALKHWKVFRSAGLSALFGVLFLQIAVNVWSEVEDYLKLVDFDPESPRDFSGRRGVLQKGWISARELRRIGKGALILGVCFGIPAFIASPGWIATLGGIAILGVFGFSREPFGFKYKNLGEVLIFALMGPLLFTGLTQALFRLEGGIESGILFLGICFGLLSAAVSLSSGLQDYSHRAIGFKASRHLLVLTYVTAFAALGFGVLLKLFPLGLAVLVSLGLPWLVRFFSQMYKASGPLSALLGDLRNQALQIYALIGSLVLISLISMHFIH